MARDKRLSLNGRIALTPQQMKALKKLKMKEDSDDDNIVVTEDDLQSILKKDDVTGLNPEADEQIVNRIDAIKRFCRDVTEGDTCLKEEDLLDDPEEADNDDGGGALSIADLNSDGDQAGQNVSLETLRGSLPSYIAKILDESSPLDPGDGTLPQPGDRLTEGDIEAAGTFPSLSLPPGPADVPAYFDFHDLQIAYEPVWQEALDESVIADAEALYDKYVEGGGQSQFFLKSFFGASASKVHWHLSNPVDQDVQRHVEITSREWNALTGDQQGELTRLAGVIGQRFDFLYQDELQDSDFTDGVTAKDLRRFNRAREYVMSQVDELREQMERLIVAARKELEQQVAGRSVVPNSRVLNEIKARLNSNYPAKYFAASRTQRSVNFGLMVTYRQFWTPTAYQVGELIKSIPLAPKEVRKYTRKTVRKRRRSRKELENNLDSLKSETNSTTRAEAEIVQDAMDKTNFNASANGSFTVGVWSGGGSSGLSQDSSAKSAETKKRMHEAVVKSAREYRNETKVELETEESFEDEFTESGEITNFNEELTVTFLFYELQRRYRVEERMHRLQSVVLVAQEMPQPGDIDEDWIVSHRWILNRVLLDDAFATPLTYLAEAYVAETFALEEARKSLEQQRRLVEELKEDISEARVTVESRYGALQRSMERSARATQRKKKSGGLFGFARKLTTVGVVGDIVDRFIGGEDETPEAARVRESAAQDAYQREMNQMRDFEAQLSHANTSLNRATEEFSNRLSMHLSKVVQTYELRNHIKDNITHYMQAIWMHEPFQQRWLRLKDVPVPVLKRPSGIRRLYKIKAQPTLGALANVAHLGTGSHDFETWPEIDPPGLARPTETSAVETVPLHQVADIDDLMGFRANYMIFPMKKANALTDFMMEPYVERAAGGFGITDPDEYGNMNLSDFLDYICCLKEKLGKDKFAKMRGELKAQLKKLLQSPLRDDEEIVVPMDASYIEALPGSRPILEDFKLLHRQIDAADAQEDLRLKKMEKLRYAQRLLDGRTDDPEADARYEFTNNPDLDFAVPTPGGVGGGGDGT
ncbi:MAG: hypothetical protein ACSHW1_15055 [Yoonia sp.]|uniref:hypothetical protein n=1 Tax=Yoonia sp. TaxID=2212373 RepID=UPI003EF7FAA4